MPNTPVPATATGLPTRRAFLAALPAVGLAPGAALALPPSEADTPILRLFRRHRALVEAARLRPPTDDDEEYDRLFYRETSAIDDEMMALPCTCAADFAAKAIVDTCDGALIADWETGALWVEARALVEVEGVGSSRAVPPTEQVVLDPHTHLIEERRRLIEQWSAVAEDTPEEERLRYAWEAKTGEIYSTRAATTDGLIAQVEFFMEDFGDYVFGNSSDNHEGVFFANLLASLRARA